MALPADIVRKENEVMEQVDVPPSNKPPMDMLNKHVLISELDEVLYFSIMIDYLIHL